MRVGVGAAFSFPLLIGFGVGTAGIGGVLLYSGMKEDDAVVAVTADFPRLCLGVVGLSLLLWLIISSRLPAVGTMVSSVMSVRYHMIVRGHTGTHRDCRKWNTTFSLLTAWAEMRLYLRSVPAATVVDRGWWRLNVMDFSPPNVVPETVASFSASVRPVSRLLGLASNVLCNEYANHAFVDVRDGEADTGLSHLSRAACRVR